jgi:hypothetical protein
MTTKKLGLAAGLCLSIASHASAANWQVLRLPDLPDLSSTVPYWSPQLAVLPDGRFVLAHLSTVMVQNQFGQADGDGYAVFATTAATAPVAFDPAFIAIKDASTAVIGAGGAFGSATPLFAFNPSVVTPGGFTQKGSAQSYAGAYWKSPTSAAEGWLVAGQVGTGGTSGVRFVSLDGLTTKLIVDAVAAYSSGVAVDLQGNLYVARNSYPNPKEDVLFFSAAQVEGALAGIPLAAGADGKKLFAFDSAGSIAVDDLGRIWAGGFASNGYMEVFDTATGANGKEFPAPVPIPGAGDVIFQPQAFRREGVAHVAFIAFDGYSFTNEFYYGTIRADQVGVANAFENWCSYVFGPDAANATISGPAADPDHDGVGNLIEYAMSSSPTRADGPWNSAASEDGAPAFTFWRVPANLDLAYVVETSSTLAPESWQEIARSDGGEPTVPSAPGAASVTETIEGTRVRVVVTDFTAGAQRFVRLRIVVYSAT